MGLPDEGSCRIVVDGSIVEKVEVELVVYHHKYQCLLPVPRALELLGVLCSITHTQEETEHIQQTNSS